MVNSDIQEFECSFSQTLSYPGTLYYSKDYLGFYPKAKNNKPLILMKTSEIIDVDVEKKYFHQVMSIQSSWGETIHFYFENEKLRARCLETIAGGIRRR